MICHNRWQVEAQSTSETLAGVGGWLVFDPLPLSPGVHATAWEVSGCITVLSMVLCRGFVNSVAVSLDFCGDTAADPVALSNLADIPHSLASAPRYPVQCCEMSQTGHDDEWELVSHAAAKSGGEPVNGDATAAEANGAATAAAGSEDALLKAYPQVEVFSFKIRTPTGTEVPMTLGVSDNAATIRHALADVFDVACETSYQLQVAPEGAEGDEPTVLNLYAPLGDYPCMKEGVVVRMIRQPYDAHSAQAHVRRLRDVLTAPPLLPSAVTVTSSAAPAAAAQTKPGGTDPAGASEKAAPATDADAPASTTTADSTAASGKDKAAEETARRQVPGTSLPMLEMPIPVSLATVFSAPSVFRIGDDEEVAAGATPATGSSKGASQSAAALTGPAAFADDPPAWASVGPAAFLKGKDRRRAPLPQCLKSLTFSGWNPVPSARRMLGDLFYLEAVTFDQGSVNITATSSGFFVNRSIRDLFNPAPASTSHHAYSLVGLLSSVSPRFRKAYAQLAEIATKESIALAEVPTANAPAPTYFLSSTDNRAAGDTVGFGGAVSGYAFSKPSWLVPNPADAPLPGAADGLTSGKDKSKDKAQEADKDALLVSMGHTFDPVRAEEALPDVLGLADKGQLRDWNEEYQNYVDFAAVSVQDRVNKARFITKIQADFVEAAVRGAMAILDGHIAPLNPAEDPQSYVYVYNNIFFTRSSDTRQRIRMLREKRARTKNGKVCGGPHAGLLLCGACGREQGCVALSCWCRLRWPLALRRSQMTLRSKRPLTTTCTPPSL